jgi:hypothetical protein
MDTLRLPTSRLTHRLLLLPGLLLLLGLVAGGVHHHAREDGSHACAICTLSHAPATTAVAGIEPADIPTSTRVIAPPAAAPCCAGPVSPSSRAPPSI